MLAIPVVFESETEHDSEAKNHCTFKIQEPLFSQAPARGIYVTYQKMKFQES